MFNNQEVLKIMDSNINKITDLVYQKQDIWIHYVVFSWRWWIGLILSILPWVLWMLFKKKASSDRYLHVGLFIIILSTFLDVLGDQYGFWHYRYNVLPLVPTYFPWDFSLMPVVIMFLIQIKPKANPFLKAAIFAIGTSYIGEPLFHWISVYQLIYWRYTYSVPIQFGIYLISHWLYQKKYYLEK